MRTHLLLHSPSSPPGRLERIFPDLRIHRLHLGEVLPGVGDVDVLISVGGEMSVFDKKRYPFLNAEAKLLEECLRAKKVFLGICLGAELMAEVLGARVLGNQNSERCWTPVRLEDQTLHMFSNHKDSFELPAGAELFASSPGAPVQGYNYGGHCFGLQFHPNSEEETIRKIAAEADKKAGANFQSREELLRGLVHLPRQHAWLEGFCEGLSRRASRGPSGPS